MQYIARRHFKVLFEVLIEKSQMIATKQTKGPIYMGSNNILTLNIHPYMLSNSKQYCFLKKNQLGKLITEVHKYKFFALDIRIVFD